MIKKLCLLLWIPSFLLAAAPALQVGKFSAPEYDAAGAMVRRLTAESARGPLEEPVLGKGALEFFGQGERSGEVLARLEFTEAIYDRARLVLRGAGAVHFRSERGEVWGNGYSYDLGAGELRLDASVVLKLPQGLINAGKAEVWLDPKPDEAGQIEIRRAELTGGVTVTELKNSKLAVDRVEAERASYTARDGLLRLPSPVHVWRDGQKGLLESDSISFDVGPVVIPAKSAETPPAEKAGAEVIPTL